MYDLRGPLEIGSAWSFLAESSSLGRLGVVFVSSLASFLVALALFEQPVREAVEKGVIELTYDIVVELNYLRGLGLVFESNDGPAILGEFDTRDLFLGTFICHCDFGHVCSYAA
jgi:hypothetical protein